MSDFIRFEERFIKPYAEPVRGKDLTEGEVYFQFNYTDEDLLTPTIQTVVFIGRNLESEDVHEVYFQDIRSYQKGVRYDSDRSSIITLMSEDETADVFEYERALDLVLACELSRKDHENASSDAVGSRSASSVGGGLNATEPGSTHGLSPELAKWWEEDVAADPKLRNNREAQAQYIADMSSMRFAARELTLHSEPIQVDELHEGSVYFLLEYVDEKNLTPVVDTLEFIGPNLEAGDSGKLYFQDLCGHPERFGTLYAQSENQLNNIFDFERAVEELMRCSLRRRKV